MYEQPEYNQPTVSKKKIIFVSVVMGVIILCLICVLINAIAKKNRLAKTVGRETTTNVASIDSAETGKADPVSGSATSSSNSSSNNGNSSNSGSTSNSSNNSNSSSSSSSSSQNSSSSSSNSSSKNTPAAVPSTGPEDSLLGLALLLGSIATFLASKKLAAAPEKC